MKKILMCVAVVALFAVGCTKDSGPIKLDDDLAALKSTLAQYNNACANIAFQDSRAKVMEAEKYRASGENARAEMSYQQARQSYDSGLASYNSAMSGVDRANAEIASQNSRMNNLRSNASIYTATEYNNAAIRVNALHADAQARLARCDVAGANIAIAEAEKEIRYIEDLVALRMGQGPVVRPEPEPAGDQYIVKKGDCLWKIAAAKYSNPYFWPLIYWSNQSSIKDPDLIYPGQALKIEYNQSQATKDSASKLAKTRGAWSLYDGK